MLIPATRLVAHLTPGLSFEVRTANGGGFHRAMPYTEAVACAIRGELEGIASQTGRIKYLRVLPENQRQAAPEIKEQERQDNGRSTAFAVTNLGVYRQAVESAHLNEYGITEREIIGYTYAFCAHRRMGL